MGICDFERKWWHARLEIEDQNNSVKSTHTTVDPDDAGAIADSTITVRVDNATCEVQSNPPAAWDSTKAPGWFIFRPTVDALGGDSSGSIVAVSTYEDVINIDNRRVFRFTLLAAYDSIDVDCTTTGPPDTHCPEFAEETLDDLSSIVFRFTATEFIDELGCCDIPVVPPDPPGPGPGLIRECFRLWFIVEGDGADIKPHLYSWNLELDPSEALVDRGAIDDAIVALSAEREYHDLAWESRNFLWGLEKDGLKRILPGNDTRNAIGVPAATIQYLSTDIFPIDSSLGRPGMSYNQNNGRLYIYANNRFYELEPTADNAWTVTKESSGTLGDTDAADIAFDPFGNAYSIYNSNLSLINYADPPPSFGISTYVQDNSAFDTFRGMDFALDIGSEDFASLYGVTSSGQIFVVDKETAATTVLTGANIGETAVGMSSCQAGEDLRVFPFPFYPGEAPWAFWVDISGSMFQVGTGSQIRMTLVKSRLTDFVQQFVEDGDQMWLCTFGDGFGATETNSKQAALDWVAALPSDTNQATNFCAQGRAFPSLWSGTYGTSTLRSVVVIGDGVFGDCNPTDNLPTPPDGGGQPANFEELVTRGYAVARDLHDTPNFTIRAVSVNNPDVSSLETLGTLGLGGYYIWEE